MSKYKGQNKRNYMKKIIVLFVLIFILILFQIILTIIKHQQTPIQLSYDNLTTVKEVIEYYKSTYISENESEDEGFYLDIYLKFYLLPYDENDNSNEKYYNELLEDVAKVIKYRNYKMYDEANNINIEVICSNGKIDSIKINGIEDYFIYMESNLSMKKYKEIEITNFEITSEILKKCVDNNWKSDIDFGTRESIFNEYYIFFDEGIKVRNIQNSIYNIVFTTKYQKNVIDNISPGMKLEEVEEILGKPTFSDDKLSVIGYKGEGIYVFFTESEISVYRISDLDNIDEFFRLVDEYLTEEDSDILGFMNELTYIWPDYSDYIYSSDRFFIAYPLKGIEIKLNYDDTNGILVYNNIRGLFSNIQPYLEKTDFIAKLQIDSVYEAEKRRFKYESELIQKCDEYLNNIDEKEVEKIGESLLYKIFPEKDSGNNIYSMKFISTTGENPNRELNDGINSYLWISNNYFVYSKQGKGIYLYNLSNGNVSRIIEGKDEFNLRNFENGKLKYDNNEIEVNL